jgi:molecular chaperone GrpE
MRDEESSQNRNLAMTDTHAPDAAQNKAEEPVTEKGAPTEARPGSADPTAALNEEIASLKDRLLRALAEMENLRRRTEREVADARVYGITQFARDVVAVADNMERALQALDAEIREKAEPGVKALLDGVELTERELIKALEKHGVQKLDPKGQKFDPHRHQAMFEVPDPSVPAGTVVQVVQAGYSIGERVLRPAMVGIAKGGPKAPAGEGDTKVATEAPANDNAGVPPGAT